MNEDDIESAGEKCPALLAELKKFGLFGRICR